MSIGAVVITHVNPRLAAACLRSLPEEISDRVVVVNDPERADAIESLTPFATVVSPLHPTGYGANVNCGVAVLPRTVDVVLVLNDDVVLAPGAVRLMVTALRSRSDVAVVGPLIVDADGKRQPTCSGFPSFSREAREHLAVPACVLRLAKPIAAAAPPGVHRFDWVLGAAMMMRRSAFELCRGFDPNYFLYSEEIDLCRRLADHGWLTVAQGDAVATHVGGASTGEGELWRHGARSRGLYLSRHNRRTRTALRLARWPITAWNLGYGCAALVGGRSRWREHLASARFHHRYMRAAWAVEIEERHRAVHDGG